MGRVRGQRGGGYPRHRGGISSLFGGAAAYLGPPVSFFFFNIAPFMLIALTNFNC